MAEHRTPGRRARAAGRLAAVAVLTVTAGVAGISSSGAATTGSSPDGWTVAAFRPLPGVSNCGADKPVVRRRSFVIFCGDAGEIAVQLRWTLLNRRQGAAVGRAVANDCRPNCAAGHLHSYPARFVFSRVRTIHGAPAFTELTTTYLGKRTPYGHRHQRNRLA